MRKELAGFVLFGLFLCVTAIPPWKEHSRRPGYWPPRYPDRHDNPYDHGRYRPQRERCRYGWNCDDRNHGDDVIGLDYEDQGQEAVGCSCLLYVEYRIVFRRADGNRPYPCGARGLQMCSRFCDNLFRDEGLRASSRQDACDVLGREVHTSWYRKDQVCGSQGPYKDIPLSTNLCCRQGRSSVECNNNN